MKDLHIHTKYSDGEYDEFEIIKMIKNKGIREFAICDHDTIEGSKRVYEVLKSDNSNLVFHTGVELSSTHRGKDIHLLVRDFDYNDEDVLYLVDKISKLRWQKVGRMVEHVKEIYGVDIDKNKIEELAATTKSFGKPHIYKLLSMYGKYDREEYYMNMRKLKNDDLKLEAREILTRLANNKCYVTLAHPIEIMEEYNLTYQEIDELVKELKQYGLKGLETKHSSQTRGDYLEFSSIAKKYNLIETCGSDYHGPMVKPWLELGMIEKIDI